MKKYIGLQVFLGVLLTGFMCGTVAVAADDMGQREMDILFTSDVHSHLESFEKNIEGTIQTVGGMSRISTLVEMRRQEGEDFLLVDGGDFSMGTLFQTIFSTEAPEIGIFGKLGYDATTLGNHEFDYRSKGLADMLKVAADYVERPEILVCNVDWEAMEEDMSQGQEELSQAFHEYGIRPYTIIQKGNIKIAVIGVFGKDALACSPTCELEFKDPITSVKQTVKQIQKAENADMIVCLSHSGVSTDPKKSEDEQLAKEVPELDVIISGHTHTRLEEPIVIGNTNIVSCGEYGEALGTLSLKEQKPGIWELKEYQLMPVDESVMSSIAVHDKVSNYMEKVNNGYLKDFGYEADEVLAYNPYEFSALVDVSVEHKEHNLGNIISDAYGYAVKEVNGDDKNPISVAVAPSGTIRGTYVQGDVTVEDVFNSVSLGIGPDGVPGYPLISVYLTGEELKTAAEIDASISDYMESSRLYCSGLNYTFNPNRIILNKVRDIYLSTSEEGRIEIQDNKLYRVVGDLYTGQMLGAVEGMSYGILNVEPKFADGTPIENMEDAIIYDNGKEIKAWDAIASYMQSFSKNKEGLPQIPVRYEAPEGRKIVETKKGIGARLSNLNKYAIVILVFTMVIVAGFIVILVVVSKSIKKLKKK